MALRRRAKELTHFVIHLFEMCIPMCIGFMVGDAIYFAAAAAFGYSDPFSDLPVLSVVVVTFSMTAPMLAWMRFRGMDARALQEMGLAMVLLGVAVLVAGAATLIPIERAALAEHGLMMPAMLVPMLLRPGLYMGAATSAPPRGT
jgi:hypothetical protein